MDAIERDRELLGNQLRLRREDPLPELALAGVGSHSAVGGDRDPRIDLRRIDVRGAGAELTLGEHAALKGPRYLCGGKRDDERAGGLQKTAPRESRARQGRDSVRRHMRAPSRGLKACTTPRVARTG